MKEEALKLALEALESGVKTQANRIAWMEYDSLLIKNAITAIKEALAQPEYRAVKTYHEGKPVYVAQPQQEPVVVWELFEDGWDSIADPAWMEALPVGTKLYTSPPPCQTCEALARTVMMDQTGRDV